MFGMVAFVLLAAGEEQPWAVEADKKLTSGQEVNYDQTDTKSIINTDGLINN